MPHGPKLPPLTLSDEQRDQLRGVARSTSLPHGLVLRARMILASAEGLTNRAVAERVGASPPSGGQVASTLPRARRPRPARRAPPRSSPQLRRREGRRSDQPCPARDAGQRRKLEPAPVGRSRGRLQDHRAALVLALWHQASSGSDVQVVHRSRSSRSVTMRRRRSRSCGPRPPSRSSIRWGVYLRVFAGHNTSDSCITSDIYF